MDEYEKHRSFRDTLYGKVRHGVHKKTGTHVIIKEYNKIQVQRKITADGQLIAEDAQEEIRIHAKLVTNGGEAHPYIVQMYDVQQDADRIYTILEYCAKGEFFPFVQHADFTEALTRHYFAQLMEGVAYLHDKEVCHRDLSLENILLDGNDVLKICDFGLAMEAKEGTIVTDGQAVGKQKYMAPEVFGGHEYDPRKADMWSCGIILFVMLVRAFPYELPTSGDARFVWVYSGRIAQLLQSWGRVLPADAIDLLNRLLCPPDRRLTARQVLAHPFCQQLTRSQAQPQTDASMFAIQDVNQNTPQSPLPPQQQHQQHQQQHQQQQQYYHHQLATSSPTATASSTSTSSSSTSWLTSCACGGQYDHTFVYCPSCNAVNPMALGSSHHSHETSTSGSSTLLSAAIVDDTKHPSPSPSPPQHQEYAQYGAASVTSSPAYASPHIHASSSSHQASGRPPDTDMDTTMR